MLRIGGKDQPAKWMREYRAYDPLDDLSSIDCAVLAITGDKDIQVDARDLARIQSSVTGHCTVLAPADLTHVLRKSTDKPSITRYASLLRQPVDNDLVKTISAWTRSAALDGCAGS